MIPGPKRKSLADRFWPRVDQSGGPTACWPWTGSSNVRDGKRHYGRIARGGDSNGVSPYFTHRVAYALSHGISPDEIPPGVEIRHKECHNPPCCNPEHLEAGSSADNKADSIVIGRMHYQLHGRDERGRFMPKEAD